MRTKIFIAIGVVAAGTGLLAQSGNITRVMPPNQGISFAAPWRPPGDTGQTKIIGTVIDIRMIPVAHAKVQLRSLVNGTVQQAGESDDNGEYEFQVDSSGTYVVEMILADGNVIAISNAGSLARYETMRTVIQLPGRWDSQLRGVVLPQNPTSFLGMSSLNTMTATTMTIAATQNVQPVNSGEPVSPVSPTR
jgi:hypothetical protein